MKRYGKQFVATICLIALFVTGCGPTEPASSDQAPSTDTPAEPAATPTDEAPDEPAEPSDDQSTDPPVVIEIQNKFEIPGVLAIGTPDGYQWNELEGMPVPAGAKGRYLICQKEGERNVLMLIVSDMQADTSGERVAILKGQWNAAVEELGTMGLSELDGTKPPLEGEIPKRVVFEISGIVPGGERIWFKHGALFGDKRTYQCTAVSSHPEVAGEMMETFGTLQEL